MMGWGNKPPLSLNQLRSFRDRFYIALFWCKLRTRYQVSPTAVTSQYKFDLQILLQVYSKVQSANDLLKAIFLVYQFEPHKEECIKISYLHH